MELSKRITGLTGGGSDGWGILYAARALEAKGQYVANLTIGEHDIRTQDIILDAMHAAALGGHTGYASVPGTDGLRHSVAQRITQRTGVRTEPQNVLITPGGQAALFTAHMAVLDPGDRALFVDPYYATYPGTIRGAGGVPVPIAARSEDGFQLGTDAIDNVGADATSLLINSPNNPTGAVYSSETLHAISEACRRYDLWLISDEVYDTQVWDGTHISPRSLSGMADRTLVVGSLSKSHAMTGSRLGWIIGPEDVIEHAANLATHTTYGVPGYIQDAGEFALAQGSALENEIAAPFRRRRQIVLDTLGRQQIVKSVPAQGAMYVMLDIRATGLDGESFASALLAEEAIAVMPGESFGASAAGHIRVAMTLPDDAFAEAFARVIAFATARANAA
ncbi:MAG: aminotransferase class I/II-fold pyridoxal phosphate-dependent enzyme [Dinoroseobacter sp.]|nr:aminotransferase class I/II-fold pyridoxal phosphate-dependent enzyme [Dinoroseobacter sp.]